MDDSIWITVLRAAGVMHFVTLVVACFTPIPRDWDKNLARLPDIHRRFAIAQNIFIGATLAFCGTVSLFFAPVLAGGSTGGRIVCAGIALWWGGRLAVLPWLRVGPDLQGRGLLRAGLVILYIACACSFGIYSFLAIREVGG